ncbi:MAG TPA: hypothetical protein VFG41_09860 [Sphingomicrobium sp.]|nr:hypothetical protein [Sphingomicrobium sp.]
MTVARFVRLLALIAVLLLPLGMAEAPARPHSAHGTAMPMRHCPEQPPSKSEPAGLLAQCTMACSAALPAADAADFRPEAIRPMSVPPALAQRLDGLHPETSTPPPKFA